MLVLVKKPHIELSIHGESVNELLTWIKKKYDVVVLTSEEKDEYLPIESTEFWKEMEKNRIGNLLAGARLKAGLTQTELAEQLGVRQNMVSDYERGRRTYSDSMASRLSETLKVKEEHLKYGSELKKTNNGKKKSNN
ncbi:MAG: helix-turn-helix transcriptional regulator [Candidatus Sabulitectum sp.]|nr:helix-turn-helix transcriptional regulator [Candidatus Sabulitectum sp.]